MDIESACAFARCYRHTVTVMEPNLEVWIVADVFSFHKGTMLCDEISRHLGIECLDARPTAIVDATRRVGFAPYPAFIGPNTRRGAWLKSDRRNWHRLGTPAEQSFP